MSFKKANSAIGMLLTLLIVSLLFILMMPHLKDFSSGALSGTSLNKESVESRVNQQVTDIENARKAVEESMNKVNQEY